MELPMHNRGPHAFFAVFILLDQKAEREGAAREIHKASCAAVDVVPSD